MFSLTEFSDCKFKLIRDPVYGFIEIPVDFVNIIDNKFVQRLRWVSQLPLEQLVYPSAQHSRFEHSLGVMYLAIQAAIGLLKDKDSYEKIKSYLEEEKIKEKEEIQKKFFVYLCGIVGLLHDLGHAPFSHTLEDAFKYVKLSNKEKVYNHEEITLNLYQSEIKHDLESTMKIVFTPDLGKKFVDIVESILNKNFKVMKLKYLKRLIRSLIDGPIDVDKGDYLLRDSYHCGVNYGIYEWKRLWRHLKINSQNTIGVSEKGALEAWTLRIARYKMFKNVYKHHVRNITDSMLIRIISDAIEIDKKNIIFGVNGFSEVDKSNFLFWNDSNLLSRIDNLKSNNSYTNVNNIKRKIEAFLKRELPKKIYECGLVYSQKDGNKLLFSLKEEFKNLENEKGVNIYFIIYKEVLPPVFTPEVVQQIVVITDKKEISLAKYLKFANQTSEDEVEDVEKGNEEIRKMEIYSTNSQQEIIDEVKEILKKLENEGEVSFSIKEVDDG